MLSINELYSSVYEKLKEIKAKYLAAESQMVVSQQQDEVLRQKRIENLRSQLAKIDDYRKKVEYFKIMAEKHIESKNILTITPRELNFNRLRNWAMMVDSDETDDPYAQRMYVQAKCNELYLDLKEQQFKSTLEELENGGNKMDEKLKASIDATKRILVQQCREVLQSEEFSRFAAAVVECHSHNRDAKNIQRVITDAGKEGDFISFGIYAQPMEILNEVQYIAKEKLGDYYDTKNNRILLPAEHSTDKEMVFAIDCTASKEKHLYCGLQNYLLNLVSKTEIGSRKIYVMDALHYNTTVLGALKPLENTIAIEPIPKDPVQIVNTLEQIVSSFSDIDEALGMVDSVIEFNRTAEPEKRIGRTVLVLVGYPSAFPNDAKEYIKRILLNYEHYGITPILVNTQYVPKKNENQNDVPIEIAENLFRIRMIQQRETIRLNEGSEYHFKWYELRQELSKAFIDEVKKHKAKAGTLGNEYPKRVDLETMPEYTRGKKDITLPYGVDSKDEVHSISFKDENFASYLMGASGSGKSTLLHTLITGIIQKYHPDDVELWLADFKMSEFAQYMDPMPPHIKYILLDESQELVFDLIDKLTEKMMERQRFFMKHREKKKVEAVEVSTYMPVIFVALDEFSIMSQAIADSPQYKLKLQNLLAKGRAMGIKFLFSSQTFLNGIRGLSATAKAQIQSRIAMKNSKEEINETLELSSNLKTDQVKNWIDALPPHYALYKYRAGDELEIKRLHVMYFPGKGEEVFAPQRKIIKYLNDNMKPVSIGEYDPETVNTYVYKDPVVVDGNSYSAFDEAQMSQLFADFRQNNAEDVTDEDILFTVGNPRRMSNYKISCLSSETRENILLVGRVAEQACSTAVLLSVMKSCAMQNCKVQIWAYGKNRLFKAYKDVFEQCGVEIIEGMDDVCDTIYSMKQSILNKEADRKLIVMIGMERICMDFDFVDGSVAKGAPQRSTITQQRKDWQTNGAIVSTDEQEALRKFAMKWGEMKENIIAAARAEGKSEEEVNQIAREARLKLRAEMMGNTAAAVPAATQEQPVTTAEEKKPEGHKAGAYNAKEDFLYIIKQGSRLGYHFMVNLASYSDLKQMNLKKDLFKYRMAFQVSVEESRDIFSSKVASTLPEHICQFDDTLDGYSFRPYLHKGLTWAGWFIDDNGEVLAPFDGI